MGRRFSKESPTEGGIVCKSCGHYNPPQNLSCGNCNRRFNDKEATGPGRIFFNSGKGFSLFHGIALFLGAIAVIVLIILGFELYVNVHWLSSVTLTFLLIFFIKPWRYPKQKYESGIVFLIFAFIALMGMALDQGGNIIYNQPVRLLCCEKGEELSQELFQYSVQPGETTYTRSFSCINAKGEAREISMWSLLGIRFGWYLLLCYFIYAIKFLWPKRE